MQVLTALQHFSSLLKCPKSHLTFLQFTQEESQLGPMQVEDPEAPWPAGNWCPQHWVSWHWIGMLLLQGHTTAAVVVGLTESPRLISTFMWTSIPLISSSWICIWKLFSHGQSLRISSWCQACFGENHSSTASCPKGGSATVQSRHGTHSPKTKDPKVWHIPVSRGCSVWRFTSRSPVTLIHRLQNISSRSWHLCSSLDYF